MGQISNIKDKFTNTIKNELAGINFPSRLLFIWLMEESYFMTFARFILKRMGMTTGVVRETVLAIVASVPLIIFLARIRCFKKSQYMTSFLLIFTVIAAFIVTAMIHPEYKEFFIRPMYGIERVLRPECAMYGFLFFSLVDDPDDILNVMEKYAFFDFAYILIVQLIPALAIGGFEDVNYLGEMVKRPYSLSFGYNMAFPAMVFIYFYTKKKKIIYLLGEIISISLIFIFGNRGSLLIITGFYILMEISGVIGNKSLIKKTLIKNARIAAAGVLLSLFRDSLLLGLSVLLGRIGFESRTLRMLIEGTITNGTGRELIWKKVCDAILNGGIFGYGVFGDRPIVAPLHYAGYSHDIFLELLVSFGIIGAVIIVKLIIDAFRMIFLCKDARWRELFIIYFSVSCQLFLSMSFWYVMEFWAAEAIAHKYFSTLKQKSEKDKNRAIMEAGDKI